MKLSRILPIVMLTGVAVTALSANDLIASAYAAPAKNGKAPTNRLGAEIAKDLDEGQRGVANRAQSLDMKARMLEATKGRLQAQAATVPPPAAEQSSPQAEEAKKSADESTMQLVKVYQSMKPKVAGPIFERLDLDIQVAIASKMRNASMAAIMQAMSTDGATRLTTALARPNSAPAWKPIAAAPPTGMPVAPATKKPTAAASKVPSGSPVASR